MERYMERYLEKIGMADEAKRHGGDGGQDGEERREHRPTLELLSRLQRQHLTHIPFETLDLHVGKQVGLELKQLLEKMVDRSRGGFCYELCFLFSWLLRQLGFQVAVHASDVWMGEWVDNIHAMCLVYLEQEQQAEKEKEEEGSEGREVKESSRRCYFVDVGFSESSLSPLPFDPAMPEGEGPELEDKEDGYIHRFVRRGEQVILQRKVVKGLGMNEQASTWRNRIRFHARREASEEEIARGLEFVQTSDRIFFNTHSANHQPWLQITHNGARWSLVGRDLTKIPFPNRLQNEEEDQRERRSIESEEEYRKILKDRFLVVLEGADFTELPLFH